MNFSHVKSPLSKHTPGKYRRLGWPLSFLLFSFLLMILPLEGFITSVKAVLAYVFIPQVRASHTAVAYGQEVSRTVQELLRAHQENEQLKQEKEHIQLLSSQAQAVFAENERLANLLNLKASKPWKGVWAKVAYREPSRWNTVVIDKGSLDGVAPRSAVIALENGQEGLAGVVVEVTEQTATVLLLQDEDFSAAVHLAHSGEEGLLVGNGARLAQVKYIPLLANVENGDKVYTSSSSSVFPEGILVGEVSGRREGDGLQTALTLYITPQVRSSAVRELFVIIQPGAEK